MEKNRFNDLFEAATREWDSGNISKAFTLFCDLARQGDPGSQNNVGYFYDEAIGTLKNSRKALYWYKKAAGNGEIYSCINIAKIYQASSNIRTAKVWLNKALSQGDGDAALELAKIYLETKRKDNYIKANKYLALAIYSKNATQDSRVEAHKFMNQIRESWKPPAVLDGARVLKYAIVDESVIHTGKITLIVGGKVKGPAAGIAICKYDDKANILIIYCNKSWRSFGAGSYPSIEAAMNSLEKAYKGITAKWQDIP